MLDIIQSNIIPKPSDMFNQKDPLLSTKQVISYKRQIKSSANTWYISSTVLGDLLLVHLEICQTQANNISPHLPGRYKPNPTPPATQLADPWEIIEEYFPWIFVRVQTVFCVSLNEGNQKTLAAVCLFFHPSIYEEQIDEVVKKGMKKIEPPSRKWC